MERQLTVMEYHGFNVTIDFTDENVLVDATEMAQRWNKRTNDFLRMNSTIEFIEELTKETDPFYEFSQSGNGKSRSQIRDFSPKVLKIISSGSNNGTWMHRKLAIKFAGWLSSKFQLWMMGVVYGELKTMNEDLQNGIERKAEINLKIDKVEKELVHIPAFQDYINYKKELDTVSRSMAKLSKSKVDERMEQLKKRQMTTVDLTKE